MIANIPKHWKIKKLGEIGKVKMCKRIFKDQTNKDSNGIPFYKIGTFGGIPDAFISKELYNEYKNKYPYPKKGDVLISAAGTIGRLVVFDGTPSYFQDSNIIWIENDENIALNKYLYHLYSNVKWKTTEGGIVSRLYNADVESLELPIPPLKEQEKIAEILLSCDKAIRLTTQIITQLKQRNQGLAQQLLTGEKRVKGFEKSVWKEVRLGEICKITTGKLDANEMVPNGKYRFYTCAKDYFYINKYAFDTEALLISGNGAYVGYVHYYKGKFNAYQRTYVLDSFIENIRFIKHFLDKNLKKRISNEKMEGNTPYIILSTLSEMLIHLPSLTEQNAIAQILDTAHQELKLYEQKLQLLQAQKKTLMQKLLTGEVLIIK
jgi:type I R-M system specificity subunit